MMKKLIITLTIVTALVMLCSCILEVNPRPVDPVEDFTYSYVFKGPVKDSEDKITSYQFMCYVNNNTGTTLEDVKFRVDWKDQLGKVIFSDYVTIPRLERGGKWPIGVIRKTDAEITMLKDSTASIKFLSASSDLGRYCVKFVLQNKNVYQKDGKPTLVEGTVRNTNSFDVRDPKVYVVSEGSFGIAEYGMTEDSGIFVHGLSSYQFKLTLNPPAGSAKQGRTYIYVVGTRI